MTPESALKDGPELQAFAERVDRVLAGFLEDRAREMDAAAEGGRALADEIGRLIRAGGKRLRPAFCYWGFRAAGGQDGEPIVRASAAMELLHTMALVHDDLVDHSDERRGAPTTGSWMTRAAPSLAPSIDPAIFGTSAAVVVGDVSAVLADRLLLDSGFEPVALARALDVYHRMRIDTAVGQFLDIAGRGADPARAGEVARLKGGAYTVEGPLLVGAAFADGGAQVRAALGRYGRTLGEAFQLRDDLQDGDAAAGVTAEGVNGLVGKAREALAHAPIEPDARTALDRMAGSVAIG